MSFNYDNVSTEMFNSEVNKIPEPYRTEFVKFVQEAQDKLENETYQGDAGAGLLKVSVDSKGAIKKLEIDKTLFQQNDNLDKFNKLISDLAAVAHSNAVQNVKKAVDEELARLYTKIMAITEAIVNDTSGGS
jgi:DNA-binding protein YbaB